MSTKTGFSKVVASIAALKALDITPFVTNDMVTVAGSASGGDQLGAQFYWAASSTASGDNVNVVVPDSAPASGRWLRVESGAVSMFVAAGGTVDAITATYPVPAITLYDGAEFWIRASGANAGTTPTFAPNGNTARLIKRSGGSAVQAGDIPAANAVCGFRYRLASTTYELINPARVNPADSYTWTGAQTFTVDSGATAGFAFAGKITIAGAITPTQITSNQDDYAPPGMSTTAIILVSSDAARNITGLSGGSILGPLYYIYNVGSFSITLKNNSGSSASPNRFAIGSDIVLVAGGGCGLWYDYSNSKWRCFGVSP